MSEFLVHLRGRVDATTRELRPAETSDDPYTSGIMHAALSELLRLAAEHGVALDVPDAERAG